MYKYVTFYMAIEMTRFLNENHIKKENIIYIEKTTHTYILIYKED